MCIRDSCDFDLMVIAAWKLGSRCSLRWNHNIETVLFTSTFCACWSQCIQSAVIIFNHSYHCRHPDHHRYRHRRHLSVSCSMWNKLSVKPTLAYSFFFRTVSHINVLKALTLLLHAGSLWCFQHPPSSDMDYRIFGVRTVVFSHTGDLRQSRYLLLSRNRSHLLFFNCF